MNNTQSSNRCSYCQRSLTLTKAFRCSKCKYAYYCNGECQRQHWRRGHKVHCRAISALKELNGMILDMSDQSTQQAFHTSKDMVDSIQGMKTPQCLDEPWVAKIQPNMEKTGDSTTLETSKTQEILLQKLDFTVYRERMKSHRLRCRQRRIHHQKDSVMANLFVEHLSRLSTYNVRVCIPPLDYVSEIAFSPNDFNIILEDYGEKTNVQLQQRYKGPDHNSDEVVYTLATFLLPTPYRQMRPRNDSAASSILLQSSQPLLEISFRICYNDTMSLGFEAFDKTEDMTLMDNTEIPIQALNRLICRSCGLAFVKNSVVDSEKTLKQVLRLPSGHWDEITDYLSCFEASSVDFATSSIEAKEGCILDNSCYYWLHQIDTMNLSVLAVEGYGIFEFQEFTEKSQQDYGPQNWTDVLHGATLCCDQCCDILGSASIGNTDSYRLLKHKLSAPDNDEIDYLARYTSSSFIANELVRYAETYGIFTFSILEAPSGFSGSKEYSENYSEKLACILINVVSWNTALGCMQLSYDCSVPVEVQLYPAVTLVYEETMYSKNIAKSMKWGEVDFCCSTPLMNKESEKWMRRYCRMLLSHMEWNELRDSLIEGHSQFDASTSSGTVSLRVGSEDQSIRNQAYLTFLRR